MPSGSQSNWMRRRKEISFLLSYFYGSYTVTNERENLLGSGGKILNSLGSKILKHTLGVQWVVTAE